MNYAFIQLNEILYNIYKVTNEEHNRTKLCKVERRQVRFGSQTNPPRRPCCQQPRGLRTIPFVKHWSKSETTERDSMPIKVPSRPSFILNFV